MAIALDSSSEKSVSSSTSTTLSHTCTNTDQDAYMFVAITGQSDFTPSNWDVTYSGVTMTLLDELEEAFVDTGVWGLQNPPAGTANISATTNSGSENWYMVGASFTGVDEEAPVEASNTANAASGSPSVSVTTLTDNAVVVDFASAEFQSSGPTVDVSQTLVEKGVAGGGLPSGMGCSYELKATAGAVSMDWTVSGTVDWQHFAYALRPAGDRMKMIGVNKIIFS